MREDTVIKRGRKKDKIAQIDEVVRQKFETAREGNGGHIHDSDLRRWAIEVNSFFFKI